MVNNIGEPLDACVRVEPESSRKCRRDFRSVQGRGVLRTAGRKKYAA